MYAIRSYYVESYLYHSKSESPFTLYGSILTCDLSKALGLLENIFLTDEYSLLNGLLWCHRRFMKAIDLYENQNMPLNDIFRNLGVFAKRNNFV